jgi:hypothetical protein
LAADFAVVLAFAAGAFFVAAALALAAGGFAAAAAREPAADGFFAAASAAAALFDRLPPEPDFAGMIRPPLRPLTGPPGRAESEG